MRHASKRNLHVHNGLSVSLPSSSLLRSSYIKLSAVAVGEKQETEGQLRQNNNGVYVWFFFFKW